jgi:hypothetical protein
MLQPHQHERRGDGGVGRRTERLIGIAKCDKERGYALPGGLLDKAMRADTHRGWDWRASSGGCRRLMSCHTKRTRNTPPVVAADRA